MKMSNALRSCLVLTLLLVPACGAEEAPPPPPDYLSKEDMLRPEACNDCHPNHYIEWAGSMHAYASYDPVFRAMNARGQRETNGELGDFCVQCHAPMAVRLGLTTDGLNLEEVPDWAQGVTCFFCHTAEAVEGSHNAPIRLADDLVMRGGYKDPVPNTAHASAYSTLMDREHLDSADMCGSCHDIVTPAGVHLERTYKEWQDSLFAHPEPDQQQTCGSCHTAGRDDVAADAPGVFLRRVHSHRMVGVDIALTPFPDMEAQREQIERELSYTVLAELCVVTEGTETTIKVDLENMAAGHSWPSGSAQDRRVWVQVTAWDEADEVLFKSGHIGEDEALVDSEDENLWRIGDRMYDDQDHEVHMFWDATRVESDLLPAPTAFSHLDPDWIDVHRAREYVVSGAAPARVEIEVKMRPLGFDLLRDLVASGDLEPGYEEKIPTYTLEYSRIRWKAEDGLICTSIPH